MTDSQNQAKAEYPEKMNSENGIKLLWIISMIYLIILNILEKGGILSAVAEGSTRYALAWLIQIWCSGAVSIFALLTGYTGYTEEEKRAD